MTNKNTQQPYSWDKKDCHTGNSLIYREPNGGALYIGGWSNEAKFDWNTHVIDLTGSEHKFGEIPLAFDAASQDFMQFVGRSYAGWLSLPFPDFGVPSKISTYEQWLGVTQTIQKILREGKDVLVACHGGHGRSGLFCSIVGYLLNIETDRSWSSPVEKIRKIHCVGAVETYSQEKFVYDILGLKIQIKHAYMQSSTKMSKYEACPICKTQSMFIEENGMCLGCKTKYEKAAPLRSDLTLEDIKNGGKVKHTCDKGDKCVGIWKASKCGHIVHDMIVYEGWCSPCWDKYQDDIMYAESQIDKIDEGEQDDIESSLGECVLCGTRSMHARRFGVCYDCAHKLTDYEVDSVHNTITDPYKAIPHHCDDVQCVGIVQADVCQHVVHNMEIEDGLCRECQIESLKYKGHNPL